MDIPKFIVFTKDVDVLVDHVAISLITEDYLKDVPNKSLILAIVFLEPD